MAFHSRKRVANEGHGSNAAAGTAAVLRGSGGALVAVAGVDATARNSTARVDRDLDRAECAFVSSAWLGAAVTLFGKYVTTGMLVGLALVAAMPVANSSVAWCQNAQGNVALSLGLIVLTIVLCPIATPQMLKLMGLVAV